MKNLEFNKIFASVLLAGILILSVNNLIDIIYKPSEVKESGYIINVANSSNANTVKQAFDINNVDLGLLLSSANIESGKKISKKCIACHTFEKGGHNKVGPNLWEIIGNKKAHLGDKFQYSKVLIEKGGVWDYESLLHFLYKPTQYIKGTKMSFAGLSKPDQLADMILYLHSLSDNPLPLPEKRDDNDSETKSEKK
jgi:cytochrome c